MEDQSSSPGSSPEFEFWRAVGNPPAPYFPHPQHLLTADQLFADGVLLPLHFPHPSDPSSPNTTTADADADVTPPPPAAAAPPQQAGPPPKKWKQIFRHRDREPRSNKSSSSSVVSAAELNIHIWPFSRSRSAGNNSGVISSRPGSRAASSGRKSCSAPCSRSNSRGESAGPPPSKPAGSSRRWSPLAGGIPVGRSVPVWQLRRGGNGGGKRTIGNGVGVLNLNVNTCIGYGISSHSQVRSCRGEDKDEAAGADPPAAAGKGGGNAGLFNLRAIFTKKVY